MSGVVIVIVIPTETNEIEMYKQRLKSSKKESVRFKTMVGIEIISTASNEEIFNLKSDFVSDNYRSMEKIVKDILQDLNITNAVWCRNGGNNHLQVTLSLESNYCCEELLEHLRDHNIGKLYHSSVNVIPCTIHYCEDEHGKIYSPSDDTADKTAKTTAWNRFLLSVRARLTVAEVVENVKSRAALTFDFVALILISTILCAIGLVENSNMYLLSSMLISPMMGPVMAGTFGSVIQDKKLQKVGVQNELIGLGIATMVGFCYGSIICFVTDRYGQTDWPTYEMTSRGELRSLWVGCLIALLAGAAVVLGILSDNIASLVGVAISTSLMPPAVNAGLLWSVASIYYITQDEATRYKSLTHTEVYSKNQFLDLLSMGGVSICLTFVNIVCIYAAGIMVFKIKEVAPIASKYQPRKDFWKHDIKIARDYNKTIQNTELGNLYRLLPQEIDSFRKENNLDRHFNDFLHHSTDLSKENLKTKTKRSQYTWSPCTDFVRSPNLDELKQMYLNTKAEKRGSPKVLSFKDVPPKQQYRRLSQIFPSSPMVSQNAHTQDQTNTAAPTNITANTQPRGLKKFTVTPSIYHLP